MKRLLHRLKGAGAAAPASAFASTLLPEDEAALPLVDWSRRALQIGAAALPAGEAATAWLAAWQDDRHVAALPEGSAERLAGYVRAAQVAAGQTLVAQDEAGDFFLVLLQGRVSVERRLPGGAVSRLNEARPGDLLGELALFDAGPRFAACRALQRCEVAVLDAASLQRLMAEQPMLAAALMAAVARRLSLRLRQTSARLNALLSSA